jgi:hypothetical protein
MRWFKDVFIELLNQTFTLLGFFTAWVLLEGSARKVVGVAILWSCFIWLVTLRVREPKDE